MRCATCNGEGSVNIVGPDSFGNYDHDECPACEGSGECADCATRGEAACRDHGIDASNRRQNDYWISVGGHP